MRNTKEETVKTSKKIIDSARLVFHQYGVVRPSLEKIARVAGVSRGTVYWHFENKS